MSRGIADFTGFLLNRFPYSFWNPFVFMYCFLVKNSEAEQQRLLNDRIKFAL